MPSDTTPFAAMEAGFRHLSESPHPLTVNGLWVGLSDDSMLLTELRDVLLDRATAYELRDRALCEVAALARVGERWMVALTGLVLPGLRRAVREVVARCPDLREDAEAEALAGLVEAVRDLPADATRVAARLVNAGRFRAARLVGTELAVRAHCEPVEVVERPAAAARSLDDVLAAAVVAEVISPEEAELIGDTRLDGVTLTAFTAARGADYDPLLRRRLAAEARLALWVTENLRSAEAAERPEIGR